MYFSPDVEECEVVGVGGAGGSAAEMEAAVALQDALQHHTRHQVPPPPDTTHDC